MSDTTYRHRTRQDRPETPHDASTDPDLQLGALGWLMVMLLAVMLTILIYSANARSHQSGYGEPIGDPDVSQVDVSYVPVSYVHVKMKASG